MVKCPRCENIELIYYEEEETLYCPVCGYSYSNKSNKDIKYIG